MIARVQNRPPWHRSTAPLLTFFPIEGRLPEAGPMTDVQNIQDQDPEETREWLESIDSVIRAAGAGRAHYLLEQLLDRARRSGAPLAPRLNTPYVNTIPV